MKKYAYMYTGMTDAKHRQPILQARNIGVLNCVNYFISTKVFFKVTASYFSNVIYIRKLHIYNMSQRVLVKHFRLEVAYCILGQYRVVLKS